MESRHAFEINLSDKEYFEAAMKFGCLLSFQTYY